MQLEIDSCLSSDWGSAIHSWHNSCLKAGENKQGNTCQTDKCLGCLELSAEAVCFLDKEDCSPKSWKDKLEEKDECGSRCLSTWKKKTNRKDVPPRRILLRGSAFPSPQKMLEAAIWPREPRSWLGPHAEGSASGILGIPSGRPSSLKLFPGGHSPPLAGVSIQGKE